MDSLEVTQTRSGMTVIEMPDMRRGYVDLVWWLMKNGDRVDVVKPDGMQRTIEARFVTLIVHDTLSSPLPTGVGRGTNTGIGAVEAMQLLGGVSEPELVVAIGPQFESYREDNGVFWGAYGPRVIDQLQAVERRLRDDPNSRQAYASIWDRELDIFPGKLDYPCTTGYTFSLRDDTLDTHVHMRSNDVWLGTAYDVFQHSRVHHAMAAAVGYVTAGRYIHNVTSLHIYERHWEATERLHHPFRDDEVTPPVLLSNTWDNTAVRARAALSAARDDSAYRNAPDDERWYAQAMRDAIDRNRARHAQWREGIL